MQIGTVKLSSPFCQAGLAGYSDRAMRVVARRRGCPYAVTEALLDITLCNGGEGLRKSIDINDEDHPVAGQIIGSDSDTMSQAAGILAGAGYDVIDLNFACPVKKIKNKAHGGHMLLDVERGISIMCAVRDTVADIPLTVSLRRGFDDSAESEERFFRIMETAWSLGFSAAHVHARTVEQKYLGSSHWPFLTRLKQQYPNRTILGSGDIFTAQDAVRMYHQTGVDAVWITARSEIPGSSITPAGFCKTQKSSCPLQPSPSSAAPSPSISRSPSRFTANRLPAGGCGKWESSTADFIRRPSKSNRNLSECRVSAIGRPFSIGGTPKMLPASGRQTLPLMRSIAPKRSPKIHRPLR